MLQDRLKELPAVDSSLIYGEPHETADGSTIITVLGTGGLFRRGPRALGVFVVHGGEVKWEPAVDASRVETIGAQAGLAAATLGVLTGLVAATIATLAVFKRPPWPDLHITQQL
ncbi:MAG: hypothetical protein JWN03_60 [Nocardia sp.]|uniref:hypothetical protein n=1 Tax=Nocardia sp. TaxID=1821 RepID=UPI002636F003|nr:hypothetical protein [Nocardia sp.]MCU1639785.1 hypothetical protein [Nocardia sp.]